MKNKIDELRHIACIQQENRNAVAYDCRDVAIILRQLKINKSQSTHTFHNERKKVFEPMFVKTKSNHEALGLWQHSLRLHDAIDF